MQILKRPQFLLDLAGELNWLKDKAGADVAERWYQGLLDTIEELKQHPHRTQTSRFETGRHPIMACKAISTLAGFLPGRR